MIQPKWHGQTRCRGMRPFDGGDISFKRIDSGVSKPSSSPPRLRRSPRLYRPSTGRVRDCKLEFNRCIHLMAQWPCHLCLSRPQRPLSRAPFLSLSSIFFSVMTGRDIDNRGATVQALVPRPCGCQRPCGSPSTATWTIEHRAHLSGVSQHVRSEPVLQGKGSGVGARLPLQRSTR